MSFLADCAAQANYYQMRAAAQVAAGNLAEGVADYEQALRLVPDLLEARHELGTAYHKLGRWDMAAACFRKVLGIWPCCAAALNNLGNALKEEGKLAEAIDTYQQAVNLEPDNPDFSYHLGIAYHESEDLDQAMTCYRRALRLNPDHADASNNLATALKEKGLLAEAVSQFRESLRINPDHVLAYYNLSELAAEGQSTFSSGDLERLKKILGSERSSPLERSLCSFSLAAVLNKQGAYDEAFGFYKQANDLRSNLCAGHGKVFSAPTHRALVDRIISLYDCAYFQRAAGWGADSEMPIFIVGMPRCGSTLVEQILASHPKVYGAGELGEIPQFVARLAAQSNGEAYRSPLPPDKRAADEWANGYLQRLAYLGHGAARVTIKTLENFLHLGMIATLFPRCRIIHCRRDPIDVCLSCYFQNFQDVPYTWRLEDIGAYYCSYERLMAHWSRTLPVRIHEVCYEDLVRNQETTIREMVNFCGLAWDERCLSFFKTPRTVRTASAVQVRKPISARSIGRWKHYASHLEPLFRALGEANVSSRFFAASGNIRPPDSKAASMPVDSI